MFHRGVIASLTMVTAVHAGLLYPLLSEQAAAVPEVKRQVIQAIVLAPPAQIKKAEEAMLTVEKPVVSRPVTKKKLAEKAVGYNKPEPNVEPETEDLAQVKEFIAKPDRTKSIDKTLKKTDSNNADNNIEDVAITPPNIDDATLLNNRPPSYPRLSKRRREEGLVILELLVLADGSVAGVTVKTSSGFPRLDKAALVAVSKWHYTPATRNGEAVAYRYEQPIEFAMK